MQVELMAGLHNVKKLSANRVLLCDDNGTPFAFVMEYQPGHYRMFRAIDPDFETQLRAHGIDRTVAVTRINKPATEETKPTRLLVP